MREGRCREFAAFGWKPEEVPDPQARETFERSKLNWNELSRVPHKEILDWHKKLIQLRRDEADLGDELMDHVRTYFDEERRWLVIEHGAIRVACNLASQSQAIPLVGKQQILLASETGIEISGGNINLPPDSVVILRLAD